MRKIDKHLRPDVFVKESLDFMQGYPKWKVWLYMPVAYCKMVYYYFFD